MNTHWISSSRRLFFFCPAFYASWILRLNFEARLFITSFYLLGLWGRDLSAFLIDFNLIAMLVKEVDGPKVSSRWFCSFLLAISFLILASCFLSLSFFFFFYMLHISSCHFSLNASLTLSTSAFTSLYLLQCSTFVVLVLPSTCSILTLWSRN